MWVYFGEDEHGKKADFFRSYGIFIAAALFGAAGSAVLITSLSLTASLHRQGEQRAGGDGDPALHPCPSLQVVLPRRPLLRGERRGAARPRVPHHPGAVQRGQAVAGPAVRGRHHPELARASLFLRLAPAGRRLGNLAPAGPGPRHQLQLIS